MLWTTVATSLTVPPLLPSQHSNISGKCSADSYHPQLIWLKCLSTILVYSVGRSSNLHEL